MIFIQTAKGEDPSSSGIFSDFNFLLVLHSLLTLMPMIIRQNSQCGFPIKLRYATTLLLGKVIDLNVELQIQEIHLQASPDRFDVSFLQRPVDEESAVSLLIVVAVALPLSLLACELIVEHVQILRRTLVPRFTRSQGRDIQTNIAASGFHDTHVAPVVRDVVVP